ncbi:HrpE/YscL family type III secretion apparatus protein [Algicola sagamiensis]|uniref:HrpE/YscL family type III secretion apparatus protein n=1 Tax=Algicola sagamiensis TaxID=163869 RepID=UPI00037E8FCA|nr:HrpE/YscL family type III secretion apparatus protein [Algicola sagamiensis]
MVRVIQLNSEAATLSQETKILSSEQFDTFHELHDLLVKTQERKQALEDEAASIFEKEKERGYQEGLLKSQIEIAEQQIAVISQTINFFASVEQRMVDLVIDGMRQILGELDVADVSRQIIKQALRTIGDEKQVKFRVAPENVSSVQEQLHMILSEYPSVSFAHVEGDPRIRDQGCILETDIGLVDATVQTQLEALQKALEKNFASKK